MYENISYKKTMDNSLDIFYAYNFIFYIFDVRWILYRLAFYNMVR